MENYATVKGLAADFLAALGLQTVHVPRRPAVKMPYYELVIDLVSEGLAASVNATVRETVETLAALAVPAGVHGVPACS